MYCRQNKRGEKKLSTESFISWSLRKPSRAAWIFLQVLFANLTNLIPKSLRFQLEILQCHLHMFLSEKNGTWQRGEHKIKQKIQNYVNKIYMQRHRIYLNYSINHSKNNMGLNDSWKNSSRLTPLNYKYTF